MGFIFGARDSPLVAVMVFRLYLSLSIYLYVYLLFFFVSSVVGGKYTVSQSFSAKGNTIIAI